MSEVQGAVETGRRAPTQAGQEEEASRRSGHPSGNESELPGGQLEQESRNRAPAAQR